MDEVMDTFNTSRDLYGDKGYVDKERKTQLKAAIYNLRRLCSLKTCKLSLLLPFDRKSTPEIVKNDDFRLKTGLK
jgi:hypothetical protein